MEVHKLGRLSLRGLRDEVLSGDPACLCDPELFTGPAGIEDDAEPEDERAARVAAARDMCAACPVRLPCLAYALRMRPASGVWAGFTAEEITDLAAAAARPARPNGRHMPLRDTAWLIGAVPGQGKAARVPGTPAEVA
jgi:hypothetical protein